MFFYLFLFLFFAFIRLFRKSMLILHSIIYLLLEDKRSIKTKYGANHAPPLIKQQSD